MFTDMKDFTHRTSAHSREQIEKLIDLQDKLILPIIDRFDGKVIKTIGDSYMVVFDSPTSAVLCGKRLIEATAPFFELRVVLNTGEVNVKTNDIFGEPVNLVARLESSVDAGEVYLTEAVYLAMNKNEIPLAEIGTKTFKGIPRPVKIYKVLKKKSLWGDFKNWFMLRRFNFFSISVLLIGLGILGAFLSFGRGALPEKETEAQVLSSEAVATPTPTPSPSPTLPPTPIIQQIIREVLITPEPTLIPTPTPIFQKGHKR